VSDFWHFDASFQPKCSSAAAEMGRLTWPVQALELAST